MDPYQIILRPHISEKTHDYIQESNTYTFVVHQDATKSDIKAAVKAIWDVDTKSVRTINVPGKIKRFGRTQGRSATWRKAIVRVADGQAIESLR